MIGQYLIDLVDEAGYLSGDLAAAAEKLGTSLAEIEAVLGILQSFDPPGVCARDLAECLAIQLKEQDRYDPGDAGADRAARSAGAARFCRAEKNLRRRRRRSRRHDRGNPQAQSEARPRLRFGDRAADRAGCFRAAGARRRLAGRTQLRHAAESAGQSELLRRSLGDRARDTDKSYLAECLQSATWLVRALDQRARTILKVANEIVRQQDAFFAHGVEHLRPLNLKTVAEAIGMHESTVSRVTANKYMATSRGIFELKYFFTSAIAASHGGEAHSAEAVRHRIKQLIDAESAADVLSDDTIVEKLREAGIDIARRTVAKYREAMRIPSSVQRRREKQAPRRSRITSRTR